MEEEVKLSLPGQSNITNNPLFKRKVFFSFNEGAANNSIHFHSIHPNKFNKLNFFLMAFISVNFIEMEGIKKYYNSIYLVDCNKNNEKIIEWMERIQFIFDLFLGQSTKLRNQQMNEIAFLVWWVCWGLWAAAAAIAPQQKRRAQTRRKAIEWMKLSGAEGKIVSGMNEMTNEFHFCFDGINENEMNERNESEWNAAPRSQTLRGKPLSLPLSFVGPLKRHQKERRKRREWMSWSSFWVWVMGCGSSHSSAQRRRTKTSNSSINH